MLRRKWPGIFNTGAISQRLARCAPTRKEALFAITFLIAFLFLDGASTAAQKWEGAPPCYLPVALGLALVLQGGPRGVPLLLVSSIVAARLNYHRPLFSWCGIPGAIAVYTGYIIGGLILRKKWKFDPRLSSLRDVGLFVSVSACAAIVSMIFGMATLLLDGVMYRWQLLRASVDWYASDIIAVVTICPFLLISIAPRVRSWIYPNTNVRIGRYEHVFSRRDAIQRLAQVGALALAIWLLFAFPAATPYQPLYLLFVPLVWAGLQRGVRGAAFVTFVISIGIASAAGLTEAHKGSLPRLQLASLVLGLTGLCMGAAVSERKRAERDLRRSEEGLIESQRVARLGSWTLDVRTGAVTWTSELFRTFGLDPSVVPPPFSEHHRFLSPDSWRRLKAKMDETLRNFEPFELELQILRKDGGAGWILARGDVQRAIDGTVTGLCGISQDITERKQAEDALAIKNALLEAQAETSIDGILVVNESDQIILANKQFGLQFDIPDDLLTRRDDRPVLQHVLSRVESSDTFLEKVNYLYRHPEEKSRDEVKLRNGKVFERYSAPLSDSNGVYRGRIWYFRDITDRKLSEQRAQFLAYYDALTGLPNRTLLQDRLSKALARAARHNDKVALLFLDLDRFKAINDCLGHNVGDLLLKEVAGRLKNWGRQQDTISRLGGDEFLLMLSDVKGPQDAAVSAERLMDAMNHEFIVQGHSLNVCCSIGISLFPDDGVDPESLIKNADFAMYSAKESGRNNFRFFTSSMSEQSVELLELENGLRSALDNQELFLMYQPQVEIATGRITGLEALLRWKHPVMGIVPPKKFIKIAENSGMIVRIGEWVLRTACAQARKWMDEGRASFKIAVNVSVVQFRQEGFCELVKEVLQHSKLPAQLLELEITESVLLSNEDLMLSILRELKSIGVGLSIDDFGTGYSSFSYLRQSCADKFKIDRSFIRDVAVNPDDAAITAAIISMAKSLRLRVIAEGVEHEAQVSFLRNHDCDEIQGYYFSKPLATSDVSDILGASPRIGLFLGKYA